MFVDFVVGDLVVCYNVVIGYVLIDLCCGSWVNECMMCMFELLGFDDLLFVMCVVLLFELFEGYMFEGFCNVDGLVGMCNIFVIMMIV